MDDMQALTELNSQFIEAFRRAFWELLEPVLSPDPGRFSRDVHTYERRPEGWRCVHACVWPLLEQT